MASEGSYSGSSSSDDPLANAMPPQMREDIEQIRADYNRFDFQRYPQPLPVLGPLFGFHEGRVRKMVVAEWAWARRTLRRQLNSDEEDALAGAACKQMRTMSYAGPLGAVAGMYRAYATRETWRLPFWAMGEGFDPNVVKVGAGRELLRGEAAKTFWRVLRNGLYGANGVVFSMCIFASFSASSVSVAIARDPRLQEFAQAITQQATQMREQRMQRARGLPPRADPTGQGSRSVGELWKNHRTGIEGPQGDYDDASPSGGQGMDSSDSYATQAQSRAYSEGNDLPPSGRPTWQRQQRPAQGAPMVRSQPPEQSPRGDFIDDWDDASPVAAPTRSPARQPYQGSGSAWERVRREAADGPNDSQTTRDPSAPRSERGANTGYTFSTQDEDRQLARGEAQKEFDARIERERHGGNFDEGRGQKKW